MCRQTCKDFEWLIIDDGSTDNTQNLVNSWIKENKIPIRYIHQDNQGMHGAHNTAYRNIETELNICIDSDDYMPDNAVETIHSFWEIYGSEELAGMIGLDETKDGKIIGTTFPEDIQKTTLTDFYRKGGKGDKKLIYRTDIINKYPEYPIFEEERYVGLGYKYQLIDQDYLLLAINKPLAIVEYQEDGSSMNIFNQYWNNPRGFAFIRKIDMKYAPTLKRKFQACIHYVSSSIRSKNWNMLLEAPLPLLVLFAFIPGIGLYFYTKYRVLTKKKYQINK
ncbi:MAG: glycosyltransferase family 2 protein [Bacteroides sp.]|nr:glycosyltransferase family 2 protein [Bacteroides sp.]